MSDPAQASFACDAMLGHLARWLRAAGYDASWRADIDDWDLIRLARREKRILLSCDTGIFRIGLIRDGEVPALLLPNNTSTAHRLQQVLEHFQLPLQPSRCMACGGQLVEVPRAEMEGRVPTRVYEWVDKFLECKRCTKPFWSGTHWDRIQKVLQHVTAPSPVAAPA